MLLKYSTKQKWVHVYLKDELCEQRKPTQRGIEDFNPTTQTHVISIYKTSQCHKGANQPNFTDKVLHKEGIVHSIKYITKDLKGKKEENRMDKKKRYLHIVQIKMNFTPYFQFLFLLSVL